MDKEGTVVVGFLGCGNVGGALYKLLQQKPIEGLTLKSIVVFDLGNYTKRSFIKEESVLSRDWDTVLLDDEVDIVVETIGVPKDMLLDEMAARIQKAILGGKSLITANKRLISEHWQMFVEAMSQARISIGFEASVGGAIPIIEPLKARQLLEEVQSIVGILNATSNYILTRMAEGEPMDVARTKARRLGLAEADDAVDLDGSDAAYKIAILASLAFGTTVDPSSITLKEGIQGIGMDVFKFARTFGYSVKPIAVARLIGNYLEVGVYPALLPAHHPLATVHGDFNAVLVQGKFSGWHMFSGRGAGPEPTATAMYNDLARIVQHIKSRTHDPPIVAAHTWRCIPRERVERRGYFHAVTPDKPGYLGRIATILGEQKFNIRQFDQVNVSVTSPGTPIMLSTDRQQRAAVEKALNEIRGLDDIYDVRYLPIEDWEDIATGPTVLG